MTAGSSPRTAHASDNRRVIPGALQSEDIGRAVATMGEVRTDQNEVRLAVLYVPVLGVWRRLLGLAVSPGL